MLVNLLAALFLSASVVCENGVCRLVPDSAAAAPTNAVAVASADLPSPARIAEGAMDETAFLAFLSDRPAEDPLSGRGLALILILAVLGGLAMNLTPCVLPMVPVNLLVIGASPGRGFLYGLGQFLAFGTLGVVASLGGAAFGTLQSSPWFNLAVAILFVALALSLAGVFPIDFSRHRRRGTAGAFLLGVVSALLAGACVAPILASVLLLAARLSSEGSRAGLLLPLAVAFGLALPWPFLGAGLKILPRPGAWMKWVNRAFAVFVAALAVHYLVLAAGAFRAAPADGPDMSPLAFSRSDLLVSPHARPLLVFCHADWCRNCPAMERLMTESPRVRAALGGFDVVRLKVVRPGDLAALPGLAEVRGLPAFAVYAARRADFDIMAGTEFSKTRKD